MSFEGNNYAGSNADYIFEYYPDDNLDDSSIGLTKSEQLHGRDV